MGRETDIDVESGASRLRIGVLASIAHRTPPRGYGPWEQVASTLAEGLVALGHDVTLFATADSLTTARLHAEAPRGYEEDPGVDAKVYEGLHNAAAFERAGAFDVVSNQFDFMPLTYSRLVSTPVVTTVHGFSSERIVPVYRAYDDIGHYVAISDADRHPDLTYAATIHHGIDLSPFTFRDQPGDYLLFLGRIHPDKGTHRAIAVAQRAGLPLVIAGIVQDEDYFRALVQPHLGAAGISYVGPVGPADRDALLGGALALLHLIGFAEPFGLSVVESLATGTPVIAYPLGSMPEIIRPGRTGFLVDDLTGAVAAVGEVAALSRRHCREDVEERFTAARMVADYAELFARVVGGGPSAANRSRSSGSATSGEPDGRVARPVGQEQLVAVPQRAAGVDDVGDVAVARVLVGRQERFAERAEDPARIVPVEQQGADRVLAHRSDPVSEDDPACFGLDGRPAVPDLQELPRTGRSLECAGVAPPGAVGGGGDAVVLPVPAGEGEVPAVYPTGEQGHSLVLGGGPGELGHPEMPEVVGLDELRCDRHAVERRVGRPVDTLVLDAHEAGVLDTAGLRRALRPQHPFGERGRRRELDLVTALGNAPCQLSGTRGGRPGEPLVGERSQDRVELVATEAGVQPGDDERGGLAIDVRPFESGREHLTVIRRPRRVSGLDVRCRDHRCGAPRRGPGRRCGTPPTRDALHRPPAGSG